MGSSAEMADRHWRKLTPAPAWVPRCNEANCLYGIGLEHRSNLWYWAMHHIYCDVMCRQNLQAPWRRAEVAGGRLPPWQAVPGTLFVVDKFGKGTANVPCQHWFLSHFHADHYGGLTRGFKQGKGFRRKGSWISNLEGQLTNPLQQ